MTRNVGPVVSAGVIGLYIAVKALMCCSWDAACNAARFKRSRSP